MGWMTQTDYLERRPFECESSMNRSNGFLVIHPQTCGRCTREPCVCQNGFQNLAQANLQSQLSLTVFAFTIISCLQWCQQRAMWTAMDWWCIVFSNESWLCLGTEDHCIRVWRTACGHYNPSFTIWQHKSPTAGMMVWGAIVYDSCSSLVVIGGTLTAQQYVQEILWPHVLPFLAGYPRAIFQQDNVCLHTAGWSFPGLFISCCDILVLPTWLICCPSSMCGTRWDASFHHIKMFMFWSVIFSNCGKIYCRITYSVCLTPCLTVSPHVSRHKASSLMRY